jgi:uncharacterized radical SAM superfamily protein
MPPREDLKRKLTSRMKRSNKKNSSLRPSAVPKALYEVATPPPRLGGEKSTRTIRFFAPSIKHFEIESYRNSPEPYFVPVSITGSACVLNCRHCGRKLLETMTPATTPEKLFAIAQNLAKRKAYGMLVSGGADAKGVVRLEKFAGTIRRITEELGLRVAVHTGIITPELAQALARATVHSAMLDIIGDNDTIREVYGLKATVEDYRRSLENITAVGVPASPHIVIGLHFGQVRGEYRAVDIAASFPIASLVLVAFKPISGTGMAKSDVCTPEEIRDVIAYAREKLPDAPILLGCARPGGEHQVRTDLYAIEAGVDGIAYPCEEAVRRAKDFGCDISFSDVCCSLIFDDPPVRQAGK